MKPLIEIIDTTGQENIIMKTEATLIQIEFKTNKALKNFVKWFNTEGFEAFSKSKHNKLTKTTDDYVTCLAADEQVESGHYYELQ